MCGELKSEYIKEYERIIRHQIGGLAQLVERVLSMHEVAGSIPAFSRNRNW